MILKRIFVAALVSTALSAQAVYASNGPIQSVTLSSGGLAEIVRLADVKDDGVISIEIPLEQVDDILKSLVVNDDKGSVKDISLAGPQPIEETFKTLPFSVDQLASIPALLSRLQGVSISITSAGKSLTGTVMGVEDRVSEKEGVTYRLSVLTETGIKSLQVSDDVEFSVLDDAMRTKIEDAIAITGKAINDGSRLISIRMNGQSERAVTLTYVVAAPVWKTSYRLVLDNDGKARLQAWAILENASGEDWDDVSITLTSGEPVTLKQRLHARIWKDREELSIATVDTATQNMLARRKTRSLAAAPEAALAFNADDASAGQRGFAMAPAADTGTALEADVTTFFKLPGVYDLANGETLSTPIVDEIIEAEMVSLFRPYAGSQHPIASVVLKNSSSSSLPPGIMTVFNSEEGYIGDSRLEGLHKEDTASASFALDKKVTVTEDKRQNQQVIGVKVVDGILTSQSKVKDTSIYEITGAADAERTVVIEHPRQSGGEFTSDALDQETPDFYLLKTRVGKGEKAKITATHETVARQTYRLVDLDPDTLILLSDSSIAEEVAVKLKELSEARRKQIAADARLGEIQEQIAALEASQDRIRKNLAAVPDQSDLQGAYVRDLASTEDDIKSLEADRAKATEELNAFGRTVGDLIRTF